MSTEVAAPLRYPPSREGPPSHASPPPAGPRKPGRSRLPSLTGLRIFGSLAVVLCHVGNGFANAPSLTVAEAYGYAGVSFFFMLSGFVLAWTDTPQTARRFWWLRFARIWPLQFLLMAFAYTVISSQVKSPGPFGHVAELLLLQAWSPDNPTYACLLAFLALVLAASAALHYLVEKPAERRLRRLPVGQPRTAT